MYHRAPRSYASGWTTSAAAPESTWASTTQVRLSARFAESPLGSQSYFATQSSVKWTAIQAKRTPPSFSVCCSDGATDDSLVCYVRRSSVSARPSWTLSRCRLEADSSFHSLMLQHRISRRERPNQTRQRTASRTAFTFNRD